VIHRGYALWADPVLPSIERDTITCPHCNSIFFIKPGASASEAGGYCALCNAPICTRCCGKTCVPFEKRLDAVEKRGVDRRRIDKILAGDLS